MRVYQPGLASSTGFFPLFTGEWTGLSSADTVQKVSGTEKKDKMKITKNTRRICTDGQTEDCILILTIKADFSSETVEARKKKKWTSLDSF